jgi:hypothetical protein
MDAPGAHCHPHPEGNVPDVLIILALSAAIIALAAIAAVYSSVIPALKARHRKREMFAVDAVDRHVGGTAEQLVAVERTYPLRAQADLQGFIDAALRNALHIRAQHGLTSRWGHQPMSMVQVLTHDENTGARLGQLIWNSIDTGGDKRMPVIDSATLWLGELDGSPVALLYAPVEQYGIKNGWRLALAVPPGLAASERVEQFFAAVDQALARSACYRGKVLSLTSAGCGPAQASGIITVHRFSPIAGDELILPAATLAAIERNVVQHARHAAALAARGQSAKKGILLHGPPGTGKTHCIRWLAGAMPGHTILIISAEQVLFLDEYMALARLLQPALVVIEDVDLIARERSQQSSPGTESLLNKLLNMMDGLNEDAQITFVLTTNRPDDIEPAIASRPGRVDQAILVPMPDQACRRRLLALYGKGAQIDEAAAADIVRRTEGASAAFIKELLRRSSLCAEMRKPGAPVSGADIDSALEELIGVGGSISLKLLGAAGIGGAEGP